MRMAEICEEATIDDPMAAWMLTWVGVGVGVGVRVGVGVGVQGRG